MDFVDYFIKRIEKLRKENIISCSITYCEEYEFLIKAKKEEIEFPNNISYFYSRIDSFNIFQPRQLEILSIKNMSIIENRYLHFANVNVAEKFCFDISKQNEAEEWDIINLSNNLLITKTIGSFLTNKVWAWIDRGREIWKKENQVACV
ncbi:hypothetical protein FACS1894158_02310 [Betaproteobacteria bacterium]|nr:hypothetical protein FACS1894158_02310 [Betaproteobacteria bacterium]